MRHIPAPSDRAKHRSRLRADRLPLTAVSWMATLGIAAAALSVVAALLFSGCAGELPVPGRTTTTAAGGATTSTTESNAVRLGDQVAATWSEAIQELVPLLAETPPPASLQSPVSQLKEEYVQKLVSLGRQIEQLDPIEIQDAYDRATKVLESSADTDWFRSYVRLYDHYASGADQASQDFAVLLSTFNTLIQYSFFELLKTENPEEAERLGIT